MDLDTLENGQLISVYLATKVKRKELERELAEKLAPYKQLMENIETKLLERMLKEESQNITAATGGTAYISTTYTAPIRDREAFLNFLIEKRAWELLDLKANAPAVRQFIQDEDAVPAGVELKPRVRVNIRK